MIAEARTPVAGLRRLARLYGVEDHYRDWQRKRREVSAETLCAVLQALGAPIDSPRDIDAAIAERKQQLASLAIEPVIVAWDGRPSAITVRLPQGLNARVSFTLTTADGEARQSVEPIPSILARNRSGVPTCVFHLVDDLPTGYHHLSVEFGHHHAECLIISAPKRMYTGERGEPRAWGTFLPLYALHSQQGWGSGDFTTLRQLSEWTADLGGRAVGTLPLLAAFLDGALFEPSPYSPVSKLFWNEFYVDPTAAPEFAAWEEGQRDVAFQREIEELRQDRLVDYRRGMALKRRVLEPMAAECFASSARQKALRAFVKERPAVEDYARFRAVVEQRDESWDAWPERLRDGRIEDGDYEPDAQRYHVYVQLLAHEQLLALRQAADARNTRLYFDLPLGVNGAGYDVWRERDAFATRLSGGAPPDAFFTKGQRWGFPPAHPEHMRAQGYRYLRNAIGNMLRYGRAVRVDHIMGLHHLYCIPQGMDAADGAYVRYHAEEQYAVLSVESHRNKAIIVGEDLGTVPPYVHVAMSRHAVNRTYVLPFELRPEKTPPINSPRRLSVATLNTHDMPTFAAFWQGIDIDDRLDLGLLTDEQVEGECVRLAETRDVIVSELRLRGLLDSTEPDAEEVLRALLVDLANTPSRLILTNLEDLWGETEPQNTPGTTTERVNWRRKARYTLEEMKQLPLAKETLAAIDGARRRR